jgi:class 3 adenylate cyclase
MTDTKAARWRRSAQEWIDRIDHLAARPDDSPDERLNKAILLFLGVFLVAALPAAARACAAQGSRAAAAVLLAGAVVSGFALLHFVRTRERGVFQAAALGVLLIVPFTAQWLMGGMEAAGPLSLWAALAPLLAVMFYGERRSIPWFVAYVVLGLGAGIVGGDAFAASRAAILWYTENLLLVTLLYILLRHFVAERARMRAALEREHALLVAEQEKSERLLLNILPAAIAARLKDDHRIIADGFADVSVLFADIVGFTELSSRTGAPQLVALLNDLFSRFDALVEKHGAEKIKTIGDAYMACTGLPVERADHARVIADLALDMRQAMAGFNADHGLQLDVRIGVNSGPVVAGVIGLRKFIYDLWGDTVNVASRMESHGKPGAIQISETTRAQLDDRYAVEPRGRIAVKGKGETETFFLTGRRSPS